MDKLYLGQENERDVDNLLAQINDESILKMSVDTHMTTDGVRTSFSEDQDLSPNREGIDPDLAARFASLKAPRPREKGLSSGRTKDGDVRKSDTRKSDVSASPKRSSKGGNKLEQTGGLARSSSAESDGSDSLEAELLARLQALKRPSVPQQGSDGESSLLPGKSKYTALNTPTLSEQMQALKSRSKKPPQMSPSPSDYPTSMTISSASVGSSGWCAPTSPFSLIKALNMKTPDHSKPAPRVPSKPHASPNREAKKAVKKSLSHTSKEDEQVDPSAMVADVQRLLAAVSNEGRPERGKGASKEATLAGDNRTFNMKDRDVELLKAMDDEEAISLEAEKVVEWAKDNARLQDADDEAEDKLEVTDSDESSDSAGLRHKGVQKKATHANDSDPEEDGSKPKKRKGRRRWNFL